VRNLLAILLALLAMFVFRKALRRGGRGPTPPPPPAPPRPGTPRKMVRDPQCGTYIPLDEAVALRGREETLYFCSSECREAWEREQGNQPFDS